jgi:hypothetical protein
MMKITSEQSVSTIASLKFRPSATSYFCGVALVVEH